MDLGTYDGVNFNWDEETPEALEISIPDPEDDGNWFNHYLSKEETKQLIDGLLEAYKEME